MDRVIKHFIWCHTTGNCPCFPKQRKRKESCEFRIDAYSGCCGKPYRFLCKCLEHICSEQCFIKHLKEKHETEYYIVNNNLFHMLVKE